MNCYIVYDIGVKGVVMGLGEILNVLVILLNFFCFVIDLNWGEIDLILIMWFYDGMIILVNGDIDDVEEECCIEVYYCFYYDVVVGVIVQCDDFVVLVIYSFLLQFKGCLLCFWEVLILYVDGYDCCNFGFYVIKCFVQEIDLIVGDNEFYFGYFSGDVVD